jgi:hypothetical protein
VRIGPLAFVWDLVEGPFGGIAVSIVVRVPDILEALFHEGIGLGVGFICEGAVGQVDVMVPDKGLSTNRA